MKFQDNALCEAEKGIKNPFAILLNAHFSFIRL